MKYFSIWYFFPSEHFYKRETLYISCSPQVFTSLFIYLFKCRATEGQWEDDGWGKPSFFQLMYSTNSNGNFLVLWASLRRRTLFLSRSHLFFSISPKPAEMGQTCLLFWCVFPCFRNWMFFPLYLLCMAQSDNSSSGHCIPGWTHLSSWGGLQVRAPAILPS